LDHGEIDVVYVDGKLGKSSQRALIESKELTRVTASSFITYWVLPRFEIGRI